MAIQLCKSNIRKGANCSYSNEFCLPFFRWPPLKDKQHRRSQVKWYAFSSSHSLSFSYATKWMEHIREDTLELVWGIGSTGSLGHFAYICIEYILKSTTWGRVESWVKWCKTGKWRCARPSHQHLAAHKRANNNKAATTLITFLLSIYLQLRYNQLRFVPLQTAFSSFKEGEAFFICYF